jgi:signal transduction histidine kinase
MPGFFSALARAAHYNMSSTAERAGHLEAIVAHHKQIVTWAENCPENFENRAALVAGEIARIEGRELEAERFYEEAIGSARKHGFLHNEAIAHELAGRFYAARGFETIAATYLRNARTCYVRWGADGKVRQLDQRYPHLCQELTAGSLAGTTITRIGQLDLATVLKMSQAVSSEIILDDLVERLLVLAVENAGAERCLLIRPRGDEHRIEAEATIFRGTVEVQLRQMSVTPAELPQSVLRYTIRTQDVVILDDALSPNEFSGDEYFKKARVRSVLCLPLVKQAKLIGVLYLENSLTPNAFTPSRTEVLTLLASQAAISLENDRLNTDLRHAQADLLHAARLTTMGELVASVAHEVNQPLMAIATNAAACLQWLTNERLDVDQARQAAERVIRNSYHAGDVIKSIYALARKSPPEMTQFEMNGAIGEILELLRAQLRRHDISLETVLRADLPPVMGDRVQLQQVILNLIMNGIEAMSAIVDRPRRLRVNSRFEGTDGVLVAVEDSGPGLDPMAVDRIFDPLFSTKPGGLGLGLSICRSVLTAHGGRVGVAK